MSETRKQGNGECSANDEIGKSMSVVSAALSCMLPLLLSWEKELSCEASRQKCKSALVSNDQFEADMTTIIMMIMRMTGMLMSLMMRVHHSILCAAHSIMIGAAIVVFRFSNFFAAAQCSAVMLVMLVMLAVNA